MKIDLLTLVLLNGALGIVASIMLTINWKMNPQVKGTQEWSITLWCWSFSLILLLFRDVWSPIFTVVLSNGLVVVGSFYMLLGISKYHDNKLYSRWPEAIVTTLMFIGFYYYSMVDIDDKKRVLLLTTFSAFIKFAALYYLIPTIKRFTGVGTLMAIGFITHGLFFSYHSLLGAWGPEELSAIQLQQTTLYLLLEVFMFMLWFTISVTMLTNIVLQRGLQDLADLDSLTGLLNRRSLFENCEHAHSLSKNSAFSLLMLDLDNFKQINDKYGHSIGDEVLIHFASLAVKELRESDIFGRIGGEEFLIALPNTKTEQAQLIANRICNSVRLSSINVNAKKLKYTVSIGLVTKIGSEKFNLTELIKFADKAMYKAKSKGRDKVETFISL